jgi:phosphohistidine phosphatase
MSLLLLSRLLQMSSIGSGLAQLPVWRCHFQKSLDNLIYHKDRFSIVELYVLRHGEAGKRIPSGSRDSERALTVVGKEEVEEISRALDKLGIKFDFIATSPLKRASQTAEVVGRTLKTKKGNVEEWNELKPEGRKVDLYRKLSQFKQESSVLVVGHEPYLSTMISEIAFGNGTGGIVLKKAGLAKLTLTSVQPKIRGELRWLLTPKHLKKFAK